MTKGFGLGVVSAEETTGCIYTAFLALNVSHGKNTFYPLGTGRVSFIGRLISCFQGDNEGQSVLLPSTVSQVPSIQNNLYAKWHFCDDRQ